jgi:hypothetical protein
LVVCQFAALPHWHGEHVQVHTTGRVSSWLVIQPV